MSGRRRGRRIADIRTYRALAIFVLEGTLENEEVFTTAMCMGREAAACCVTHNAGGAGDLGADPLERASLDSRHWRRQPRYPVAVDENRFREIGVNLHLSE